MKATFGAGCFWHVEDIFSKTNGISSTKVGYIGGQLPNPTYEEVCTDKTGHAEAVQVEYNPDEISFEELLDVFWKNHNPTTLNRQGPDVGIQYRSAIFYHDEKQKETAENSKQTLNSSGIFDNPIITQIVPAPIFYEAEEYHQKYFKKHGL
ncbi:MAG TPA: peptide-methionine (S)-S-oxide reductase MsrA [Nitrosopumilus sp.]|nr:peptide-methionine (S)-S-oxide reductase MsrA [Nitrosopumilus sp.]HJM26311.1 peptide-methionine (S)-S-oxide reductase MsrA [Nitrosopumilus sp.]HJO31962.1 peptide-methionine (S)-S-oxide reductase MsrA [Nitrosopumilus sp.]